MLRRAHLIFIAPLIATIFLLVPCVCSAAVDWTINADVPNKPAKLKLSPLELGSANEIWVQIIVGYYHVSTDFVNSLYDRGYTFDEIACLLDVARASKKNPPEIAAMRRGGLGWGAIAKRLGANPAALQKSQGKDSLFKRYVLAQCLAGYYKIPDREALIRLNGKGYGFDEIALAADVAARSGAPFRNVIAARATGARWRFVSEKFKTPPAASQKSPAQPSSGQAKEKAPVKGKKPSQTR